MSLKYAFLLIISFTYSTFIFAQNFRGRVVDAETNLPVTGVIVISEEDSTAFQSDETGLFESKTPNILLSHDNYAGGFFELKGGEVTIIYLKRSPRILEAVTVAGFTGEQQLLYVPTSVTHIDEEMLRLDDQTIVTQTLNQVPGVYMQTGALNTNRITIRGMGARTPFSTNKIRAYYGEIPLTDGIGETTIEDIDLSTVGSIDIYKGPNSSIYGAGLGGAIHLIPEKPITNGLGAEAESAFGSFGLKRLNLSVNHSGENGHVVVAGQHQSSNGYRDNNQYERNGVQLSGAYQWGKTSVEYLSYYVHQFAEIPSSLGEDQYENDPRASGGTWGEAQGYEEYDKFLAGVTLKRAFENGGVWKNTVYGNYRNANEPRPFNILKEQVLGGGLRSIYLQPLGIKVELIVGTELYRDQYAFQTYENLYKTNAGNGSLQGDKLSEAEQNRGYVNTFFQLDYELTDKLSIQAAANLNYTYYDLEEGAEASDYNFGTILSPRLSLLYLLKNSASVYATVSHGFSPPSLEETLTPSGVINQDIKPEIGWNYEVGSRGDVLQNRLRYDVALYHMSVRNLLVSRRTGDDQYVGINAGETVHNGIEMAFKSTLLNGTRFKVTLDVNTNYNDFRFKSFLEETETTLLDYSGNELTGVPKWQFGGALNASVLQMFYAQFAVQAVSSLPILDDNSIYTARYAVANVLFGYKTQLKKGWGWDISYRANNIFNEKYAAMISPNAGSGRFYYPGLPVNHQVSLRVNIGGD